MKLSYEGIGAWCATFEVDPETVAEGQVVKIGASNTAAACSAADKFCGVVRSLRAGVCAVQLGGLAEVKFSGTAPAAGWATLTADGKGGVCTAESGQTCLVAAVDETAGTCVIKL